MNLSAMRNVQEMTRFGPLVLATCIRKMKTMVVSLAMRVTSIHMVRVYEDVCALYADYD